MESTVAQTPPPDNTLREVNLPLFQAKSWIKFLGVMSIIQGALAAITIWGIIFAWLPIWVGILLFQSAGATEAAYLSGDKAQMLSAQSKLKTYFIIQGVTTLVGLILGGIAFFIAMTAGVLGALGEF